MRPTRCWAAPTEAPSSRGWRGRCDDALRNAPGRKRARRPRSLHKMTGSNVTAELAAEHGLSADEFARACSILGRTPNMTELGVFSVMWSEHCSYKSSKVWLRKLPTSGPRVI